MGGFVRNVTGQTAAKRAARSAASQQQQATDKSLKLMERLTGPYREFGESFIPELQDILSTEGQSNYLATNPMFQQASGVLTEQLNARAAAGGNYNSGGTVNEIFRQNATLANDFINNRVNQLYAPVNLGANTATFNSTNASNLLTNNANAQGAATLAAGMLPSQQFNQLLQVGGMAAGSIASGGAAAFLSDERTKEDIELAGKDAEGNNVYEYSYKHEEKPKYLGYMAQEIAESDPGNVMVLKNGLLAVGEKYAPMRVN